MIEENFYERRNNVHRYWQLLETKLTGLERQFIEQRLSEEQSAIESGRGDLSPHL
jgi:hypothetical protein